MKKLGLFLVSFLGVGSSLTPMGPQDMQLAVLTSREFYRPIIEHSAAQRTFSESVGALKSIGDQSTKESDSLKDKCTRLDAEYAKLPETLGITPGAVVVHSGVVPVVVFDGNLCVNLPRDTLDRFDHQRWALNLSVANAGSGYLSLEGFTTDQLADNSLTGKPLV
jgi:hypothetical protein